MLLPLTAETESPLLPAWVEILAAALFGLAIVALAVGVYWLSKRR